MHLSAPIDEAPPKTLLHFNDIPPGNCNQCPGAPHRNDFIDPVRRMADIRGPSMHANCVINFLLNYLN
jgi:hypothetical protein